MSSYYTSVLIEEIRKERIREELNNSIQKLKEQMKVFKPNTVQVEKSSNIVTTVSLTDSTLGGAVLNNAVSGASLNKEKGNNASQRDELDFSELLISGRKKPTKLEQELDSWIKRVDERPVISEKDERDRTRVIAELAKIIKDSGVDIEDKILAVRTRVSNYLQASAPISEKDKELIESRYYEYCALCELLDMNPVENVPYRVEKEISRMTAVLEKRKQDEYVLEVIGDIMEELGCHAKEDAVLDHTVGQMFAVDGHPLCDVFIGKDESGIMFEPVGETSSNMSVDKQRRIESSANSICSLYSKIEERAAEKGVILNRVYAEPALIGKMYVQSDIRERSAAKNHRTTVTQKLRSLNLEG